MQRGWREQQDFLFFFFNQQHGLGGDAPSHHHQPNSTGIAHFSESFKTRSHIIIF